MEPKSRPARKTAAKSAPKGKTAAKPSKPATTAAKGSTRAAKPATGTPRAKSAGSRGRAAKPTPVAPTASRATGPTPERVRLAKTVAGLRAKGTKWNEIAVATGKSEPTLAKLRKDVRAGVFAKLSPVASRVPTNAF